MKIHLKITQSDYNTRLSQAMHVISKATIWIQPKCYLLLFKIPSSICTRKPLDVQIYKDGNWLPI